MAVFKQAQRRPPPEDASQDDDSVAATGSVSSMKRKANPKGKLFRFMKKQGPGKNAAKDARPKDVSRSVPPLLLLRKSKDDDNTCNDTATAVTEPTRDTSQGSRSLFSASGSQENAKLEKPSDDAVNKSSVSSHFVKEMYQLLNDWEESSGEEVATPDVTRCIATLRATLQDTTQTFHEDPYLSTLREEAAESLESLEGQEEDDDDEEDEEKSKLREMLGDYGLALLSPLDQELDGVENLADLRPVFALRKLQNYADEKGLSIHDLVGDMGLAFFAPLDVKACDTATIGSIAQQQALGEYLQTLMSPLENHAKDGIPRDTLSKYALALLSPLDRELVDVENLVNLRPEWALKEDADGGDAKSLNLHDLVGDMGKTIFSPLEQVSQFVSDATLKPMMSEFGEYARSLFSLIDPKSKAMLESRKENVPGNMGDYGRTLLSPFDRELVGIETLVDLRPDLGPPGPDEDEEAKPLSLHDLVGDVGVSLFSPLDEVTAGTNYEDAARWAMAPRWTLGEFARTLLCPLEGVPLESVQFRETSRLSETGEYGLSLLSPLHPELIHSENPAGAQREWAGSRSDIRRLNMQKLARDTERSSFSPLEDVFPNEHTTAECIKELWKMGENAQALLSPMGGLGSNGEGAIGPRGLSIYDVAGDVGVALFSPLRDVTSLDQPVGLDFDATMIVGSPANAAQLPSPRAALGGSGAVISLFDQIPSKPAAYTTSSVSDVDSDSDLGQSIEEYSYEDRGSEQSNERRGGLRRLLGSIFQKKPSGVSDGTSDILDSDEISSGSSLISVIMRSEPESILLACPRLLTPELMQQLAECLPPAVQTMRWERIFSVHRDGDAFPSMLERTHRFKHSIMVVETTKGYVLGGYAGTPWANQTGLSRSFYGSGQAFIFSTHPAGVRNPSKKQAHVYKWTGGNTYSQMCDLASGQIAMGGGGGFGFVVKENFSTGYTSSSMTFQNPPLVHDCDGCFDVFGFEIYGLRSMAEVMWEPRTPQGLRVLLHKKKQQS